MVQALGILIAFCVAVVGYFQWRTAHQRIILDLFERRFQTYDELRNVIFAYAQGMQVSNKELADFSRAENRAQFLFGDEVIEYLKGCYKDLVTVNIFRGLKPVPAADNQEQQKELHQADKRLVTVPGQLELRMMPYMRLDQKMPRLWWPM